MKYLLLLSVSLFIAISGYTQKAPIRFGKIEIEDLKMNVYEPDTSAAAVLLCDYGFFDVETFKFTRIIRIKILKKEGSGWANMICPTYSSANVRGFTYNLIDDEIHKERLTKDGIFQEKVIDNYYRVRITMPNVQVGSIVDIEYSFVGLPFYWNFQETIPVMHSELRLEPSNYVKYQKSAFGTEPLTINEIGRWVATNVPAFKEEPFINSLNNYLTRFEIDLEAISLPWGYYAYAKSWESVSKFLMDHPYFGHAFVNTLFLNDIVEKIKSEAKTDKEKIALTFSEVRNLKWNDHHSLFSSEKNVKFAFNNKIGNSADINLCLYSILKKLEFNVDLIITSTRKNGIISPLAPSIIKPNHIIVRAALDDKTMYLDATEEYLPYNLLPFEALNWNGYVLNKERSDQVLINTDKKKKSLTYYNLTIHEDLGIEGTMAINHHDYDAFYCRKDYHESNSEVEYLNKITNNRNGLRIIDSKIENIEDIYLPVKEKFSVKINNQIQNLGNEIALNPLLYSKVNENPFKAENRNYPIDFGHPIEESTIVNFTIPKGYTVSSIPESATMKTSDGQNYFSYRISAAGNTISVNYKFAITNPLINTDQYSSFREFYNQLIKIHSQPIILNKLN